MKSLAFPHVGIGRHRQLDDDQDGGADDTDQSGFSEMRATIAVHVVNPALVMWVGGDEKRQVQQHCEKHQNGM